MKQSLGRIAFLVTPHAGGTFSVFSSLRKSFAESGHTVEWVGYTDDPSYYEATPFAKSEKGRGVLVDASGLSQEQLLVKLHATIVENDFRVVFVNVLTTLMEMSLPAYLPKTVVRIGIVHNITPGTYSAFRAIKGFLHAAVGVSPRIGKDIVNSLGFSSCSAYTVPNALDLDLYSNLPYRAKQAELRLLSLGRIIDADKGVLWLPKLMSLLSDIPVHLTVVGEGRDLPRLKKLSAKMSDRISFQDRVDPSLVPSIMAQHDVFVMPSRFEGFGYTLIEAMAARCVPVASRIRDVTDFVVDDGRTGLLFPIGDIKAAANMIRKLALEPDFRSRLAEAGRAEVQDRFSSEKMGESYLRIVQQTLAEPRTIAPPLAGAMKLLPIGGGWRRHIPKSLKNTIRGWIYR